MWLIVNWLNSSTYFGFGLLVCFAFFVYPPPRFCLLLWWSASPNYFNNNNANEWNVNNNGNLNNNNVNNTNGVRPVFSLLKVYSFDYLIVFYYD